MFLLIGCDAAKSCLKNMKPERKAVEGEGNCKDDTRILFQGEAGACTSQEKLLIAQLIQIFFIHPLMIRVKKNVLNVRCHSHLY